MRKETKKWRLVEESRRIIGEYDVRLTLRQLFYQLVSRGVIKNAEHNYKYLSKSLVDARIEGILPLDALEDRVRSADGGDGVEQGVEEYLDWERRSFEEAWRYYRLPRWKGQEGYVEVWVEKDALATLFAQVTQRWNVVLGICRGYTSLSFFAEAFQRLEEVACEGRQVYILYFGDFDPSGEDIYRYLQDRAESLGLVLHFEKVALTLDQIRGHNLPPMPAKRSDPRTQSHIARHGDVAVELDALDPRVLQEIIDDAIARQFDFETYEEVQVEEQAARELLKDHIERIIR